MLAFRQHLLRRFNAEFDWRDENMPVLRDYTMGDGSKRIVVDPYYEHRYREHCMTTPGDNWQSDPTYNMRKK